MGKTKPPDTITVIRTAGPWQKRNSNEWIRENADGTQAATAWNAHSGREWCWQIWSESFVAPTRKKAMAAADAALRAMSDPNPLAARVAELEAQLKSLTKTTIDGMKPVGQMSQAELDKWFESMKAKGFFQ